MTAAQPSPPAASPEEDPLAALARGAVDVYEVTARLEAAGTNDRLAADRHGRPDVFTLAAELHATVPRSVDPVRRPWAVGLRASAQRALLLTAGVVLVAEGLAVLPVDAGLVWLAGSLGWVGGQTVAGVAWTRLGMGLGALGQRVGGTLALAVLLLAGAAAPWVSSPGTRVAGTVLCVVWAAYACGVSLLVCAGRAGTALIAVVPGAVAAAAAVAWHRPWSSTVVLAAVGSSAAAVVLLAAWGVVQSGGLGVPRGTDWAAAVPAAAQAVLLAAGIVALLRTLPGAGALPFIAGGVVAAAAADPAIALVRARMRSVAARVYETGAFARRAGFTALVAAAGTTAIAALVTEAALALGDDEQSRLPIVLTAAAFTALATACAFLTALGRPWLALCPAALCTGCAGAALGSWAMGTVLAFAAALVLALTLLLTSVADPRIAA